MSKMVVTDKIKTNEFNKRENTEELKGCNGDYSHKAH